jgi:hypothetical protein
LIRRFILNRKVKCFLHKVYHNRATRFHHRNDRHGSGLENRNNDEKANLLKGRGAKPRVYRMKVP